MVNKSVFVLLAGGKSERMGADKGLLKYKQTFWILEQLNRISKSNISTVYIGLGHHFQQYYKAIPWFEKAQNKCIEYHNLKIRVIVNYFPEKGPFSTLQAVLENISTKNDVIINHIDIPILNTEELNKIISEENIIVLPNYKEKNGHPIKLSYNFWKPLCLLDINDKNTRLDYQIKKENQVNTSIIEVFDKVVTLNINTKKDWLNFLENY